MVQQSFSKTLNYTFLGEVVVEKEEVEEEEVVRLKITIPKRIHRLLVKRAREEGYLNVNECIRDILRRALMGEKAT